MKIDSINIFPPCGDENNEEGQSFLEFLFVLLIMMSLSFGILSGFNSSIGIRWEAIVKQVAKNSDTPIQLR